MDVRQDVGERPCLAQMFSTVGSAQKGKQHLFRPPLNMPRLVMYWRSRAPCRAASATIAWKVLLVERIVRAVRPERRQEVRMRGSAW